MRSVRPTVWRRSVSCVRPASRARLRPWFHTKVVGPPGTHRHFHRRDPHTCLPSLARSGPEGSTHARACTMHHGQPRWRGAADPRNRSAALLFSSIFFVFFFLSRPPSTCGLAASRVRHFSVTLLSSNMIFLIYFLLFLRGGGSDFAKPKRLWFCGYRYRSYDPKLHNIPQIRPCSNGLDGQQTCILGLEHDTARHHVYKVSATT